MFAKEVLQATPSAFGFLTTALGVGAALGVVTLLWLQRRLPRQAVFTSAVVATGTSRSSRWRACRRSRSRSCSSPRSGRGRGLRVRHRVHAVAGVGEPTRCAAACSPTLYTLVRACLLLSLTVGPFVDVEVELRIRSNREEGGEDVIERVMRGGGEEEEEKRGARGC